MATKYKWLYLIRRKESYDNKVGIYNEYKETIYVGFSMADKKPEVLEEIKELYPECFPFDKVPQKSLKDQPWLPFVKIWKSEEYWENHWLTEVPCKQCGLHPVTKMELRNQQYSKYKEYFCSSECEEKYQSIEEVRKRHIKEEIEQLEKSAEHFEELEPNYYIYKITNKQNGKVYVGFTARQPFFRWYEHLVHSNQEFGKALREIGISNFIFEVLEVVPKEDSSIEEMHQLETSYIEQFDSIQNGYNSIVSKAKKES